MRDYEVVYILRPSITEDQAAGKLEKFHALATRLGESEVVAVDHWGVRQLAYEIDDQSQGYYVVAHFTAEPAALAEFEQLALARRNEVDDLEQQLVEIGGRLEGAPALRAQLGGKVEERRLLEGRSSELQAEVQIHKLRLEALQARETELKGLLQERDDLLSAKSSFGVLVEAFGRGGIQALLIEAALPELEGQANDLLARLTDHRMTLSLETQRQSRQGNVSETLEIRIADELGTRSYELFSGGEAFRIDFALRVALARLLASRAGAPLRTLFLDEGFGTQDPGGRERLVSAIQTIQDEFDLILVVTHIEEMKEAFPVRIDVTKDDTGSSLEVVWA